MPRVVTNQHPDAEHVGAHGIGARVSTCGQLVDNGVSAQRKWKVVLDMTRVHRQLWQCAIGIGLALTVDAAPHDGERRARAQSCEVARQQIALASDNEKEEVVAATQTQGTKPPFILALRSGNHEQRTPIYCIHPPLGAAAYYINIGRHLHPDQPFYGIQSPAFNDVHEPFTDMVKMAEYYITAIRQFQPNGDFALMGHSSGANIAYEMAMQLEKKGETPPLLVLLDAQAPVGELSPLMMAFKNAGPVLYEDADTLYLCAWCVSVAHDVPLPFSQERLKSLPVKERYAAVAAFFKRANFIPQNATDDLVRVVLQMVYNHTLADDAYMAAYTLNGPKTRYTGNVVLFRCTEETHWQGFDIVSHPDTSPDSGWKAFCSGPLDVIGVPSSNHVTLIAEPAVEVMARQLQAYLDNVTTAKK